MLGDLMQAQRLFNCVDVNIAYFLDLSHLDQTTNCTDNIFMEHSHTNVQRTGCRLQRLLNVHKILTSF